MEVKKKLRRVTKQLRRVTKKLRRVTKQPPYVFWLKSVGSSHIMFGGALRFLRQALVGVMCLDLQGGSPPNA